MKERIVEKLADLAGRDPSPHTDYLQDFIQEFGEGEHAVRKAARKALETVLNDYSNFQISTIDSFFQNVLRTFAYEIDLNDSYQVELDSDFLISTGIDLTMREINAGTVDSQTIHWLHRLMEHAAGAGGVWNMHLKSGSRRPSVRKSITDVVREMNREEFKRNRTVFDEYFRLFPDYSDTVDTYEKAFTAPVRSALENLHEAARNLETEFAHAGLDISSDGAGRMDGHVKKALKHSDISAPPGFKYDTLWNKLKTDDLAVFNSRFPKKSVSVALAGSLAEAARKFYEAADNLKAAQEADEFLLWRIYSPTLPYPAIMNRVRNNIQSFLHENNLVELSDTNSMLSRIIGDDDTPFIYERLGSRLDNFLIDEFQDTSAMQWENIRPLIRESASRACDNLIIGDAKQSIYRFRNADPSLITSRVPAQFNSFPFRVSGHSREENTNHRSSRHVVEFNNLFFLMAAARLDSSNQHAGIDTSRTDRSLRELYSNVVQYPAKRHNEGYVEVRFREKTSEPDDESADDAYSYVGPMVCKLLERGYRQRDIAILVERNSQGAEIISHLVDYNNSHEHIQKIDFISDESLHIGVSHAVRMIVATLEMIAVAYMPDNYLENESISPDDHNKSERHLSSRPRHRADIASMFAYFTSVHPELDPAECVSKFFTDDNLRSPLNQVIDGLHSVSLPALIEAIIDNFVPARLQQTDAPFIAAFQDSVMDYCASYPADITSFMEWWREKGTNLSIASPEGTDAVRIMTVHKSKGLEFKCVILPEFNIKFGRTRNTSRHSGYLWLPPLLRLPDVPPLPPLLPVKIDHSLMPNSSLREPYLDNLFSETMDRLNTAYVAFTRAVDELYIVTSLPKGIDRGIPENARNCNQLLYGFLHPDKRADELPASDLLHSPDEKECLAPLELFTLQNDEETVITYGQPLASADIRRNNDNREKQPEKPSAIKVSVKTVDTYSPHSQAARLEYKSRATSLSGEEDLDTAAASDPRRRGNLLHSILEEVATDADLKKAVKKKQVNGELTPSAAETTERQLREIISHPKVAPWFDGSWRLLRERPILAGGHDWRPDRVMISPDGRRAIVVDYKFGSVDDNVYMKKRAGYVRQVRRYMKLLNQALRIDNTEGYIWYLSRNSVEPVLPE